MSEGMVLRKGQVFSFPDGNLALDLILLILMVILEVIRLYLGFTHEVTGMIHYLFGSARHSHHLEFFAVLSRGSNNNFLLFTFYFCRGILGKFPLCISSLLSTLSDVCSQGSTGCPLAAAIAPCSPPARDARDYPALTHYSELHCPLRDSVSCTQCCSDWQLGCAGGMEVEPASFVLCNE
ncbi:uncharacterized protein [Heterodontus francisci]|uniref:uncharacterized protein isoform X2 n=1 Tax=Heterodontus francisci TaxID=7792 RepID=UPI00355B8E12